MNERLIENWLTKVNEKSFQSPFCQMLIGEGYQVVHLSRHGSFEEGKDILAIAPDGTPCAFQLKGVDGGKITQKEWAKYNDQIIRLVEIPIKHPSIDQSKERRVYFVANGELEEEVRVEINNRNSDWQCRHCPELKTILKGELITRFTNIHDDLWPLKLQSEKELLELYLEDGHGYLDKTKYSHFLESLVIKNGNPTNIEGQRILASVALFASYALSPFTQVENHIAIIEGWTIFIACAIAYIEKHQIGARFWRNTIQIAEDTIKISLNNLCEEIKTLKYYDAGNVLVDAPFYRARLTWISGYISALLIMRWQTKEEIDPDGWFSNFILSIQNLLFLWGEAAVPQFLSIFWAFRLVEFPHLADRLLFAMYKGILDKSNAEGLPDPYHSLGEIILSISGLSDKVLKENFSGRSYSLDSIIQLLTRREFRGVLAENWKKTTYVHYVEFEPDEKWKYFTWHCEEGIFHESMPKTPQSWAELVEKSNSVNLEKIPKYYLDSPIMLLIYLMVYPHRLCPNVIKFLDSSFSFY